MGNYGEIIIKTTDEYWITGKSSNEREFYVIIYQKNANLNEIAGNNFIISNFSFQHKHSATIILPTLLIPPTIYVIIFCCRWGEKSVWCSNEGNIFLPNVVTVNIGTFMLIH